MKRTWFVVAAILVVAVAATAAVIHLQRPVSVVVRPSATVRAPDGIRVRVQVLNGTKVRGLARRATQLLRDRGFDVLEMGTINDTRDTTLVDLSGHPDWANRVAKVLAPARVVSRTDSSRYLDIAIVLGSSWRPPSEPFYP